MEINIFGELTIMKQLNIKPNYSDLSRKYGLDRHTMFEYSYTSRWESFRDTD